MIGRSSLILLVITLLFGSNSAFARHLPSFDFAHDGGDAADATAETQDASTADEPDEEDPEKVHSLPAEAPIDYKAAPTVTQFQVLVFPHRGVYTTPQGLDSNPYSVKVFAANGCTKYLAQQNSETGEWEKSGKSLLVGTSFLLSKNVPGPFYFECTKGFKVVRSGHKSYTYHGNFVSRGKTGKLQIINIIHPEDYLKGVVPAEVSPEWPIELLKTQAVAARTYAWWSVLYSRMNSKFNPYDMDDTVQYQAYVGTGTETEFSNAAIDSTSGQVLRYKGNIIKAYFSADSGGFTESAFNNFLEDLPYCTAKPEQYPEEAVDSTWSTTLSLAKIKAALSAKKLLSSAVNILKISTVKNETGRVTQFNILGTNGKTYSIFGPKFRLAVKLRSTLVDNIQIAKLKGTSTLAAQFSGRGFGHGVGMSQIGALQYANMGWSYDQILKFYYSGVTLSE